MGRGGQSTPVRTFKTKIKYIIMQNILPAIINTKVRKINYVTKDIEIALNYF